MPVRGAGWQRQESKRDSIRGDTVLFYGNRALGTEGMDRLLKGQSSHIGGDGKGTMNDDDMRKHASNIWRMLDELADKNPSEYERFVKETLTDGAEAMRQERQTEESTEEVRIVPSPGFSCRVLQYKPNTNHREIGMAMVFNLVHSPDMPPMRLVADSADADGSVLIPHDLSLDYYRHLRIPMAISKPFVVRQGNATPFIVVDAVVHTEAVRRATRDCDFQALLVGLAIQHFQSSHPNVEMSSHYDLIKSSSYSPADKVPKEHVIRVAKAKENAAKFVEKALAHSNVAETSPKKKPRDAMDALHELERLAAEPAKEQQTSSDRQESANEGGDDILVPSRGGDAEVKGLMTEVASVNINKDKQPTHSLHVDSTCVRVVVDFPGTVEQKDVALDLSDSKLEISHKHYDNLVVKLPGDVDDDVPVSAKLRGSKLAIKLKYVPSTV